MVAFGGPLHLLAGAFMRGLRVCNAVGHSCDWGCVKHVLRKRTWQPEDDKPHWQPSEIETAGEKKAVFLVHVMNLDLLLKPQRIKVRETATILYEWRKSCPVLILISFCSWNKWLILDLCTMLRNFLGPACVLALFCRHWLTSHVSVIFRVPFTTFVFMVMTGCWSNSEIETKVYFPITASLFQIFKLSWFIVWWKR